MTMPVESGKNAIKRELPKIKHNLKRSYYMEEWRKLVYQGKLYDKLEISNTGKLRNVVTGTVYRHCVGKTGYATVCVSLGSRDKKKIFKIHRCVAETFIPYVIGKEYINHIDCNKTNNIVENLEWVTQQENTIHAEENGLIPHASGSENVNAKLNDDQVRWIRDNYIPGSRIYGSRAMGDFFGVDHMKILNIVKNKSYRQ